MAFEEISADMAQKLKPAEKPKLEKRTNATIQDVKFYVDHENEMVQEKSNSKYYNAKLHFTFKLDEVIDGSDVITESYTFKLFDGKSPYYGTEKSVTGKSINTLLQSIDGIDRNSSVGNIMAACLGKKVQIMSRQTSFDGKNYTRYEIAAVL